MNPNQLSTLAEAQIIDVRLNDDYEAEHLVGAKNNCVFEVAFVSRLAESAPDRSMITIVYGADGESGEATAAADKLTRQGYDDVRVLEGGLKAAREAGVEITTGQPLPTPFPVPHGRFEVDLRESRLEWLGRNLINKHWGTAAIESGHIDFSHGHVTGGEFVVDLTKLECTDLAGTDMHDLLIAHLHNDDFFDVEHHPKASLVIKDVKADGDMKPGSQNAMVEGNLTVRGQTHPVKFAMSAGLTEGGKPAAQAAFSIDRTRWGILYGSGKFFNRLAGHVVNDMLEFQIRILTK